MGFPRIFSSKTTTVSAPITMVSGLFFATYFAFSLAQCSVNASGGRANEKSSITLLGTTENSNPI
ncbi:uncharacterized protein METZ01_LOCUS59010 [marine metagenome]|uniref:Uncharacterized protein n=1 Tax=marine metagenome TaxID=408172 RepID=A0A381SQ85_9ZZZZ